MSDALIHVYRRDTVPFRTLAALPDGEALRTMQELYVAGSVFWERFKDPAQYLRLRRQVEDWLLQSFTARGGVPQTHHPIYMIFGRSRWLQTALDPVTRATTMEIEVPLAIFAATDISFTVPDSMIAFMLAQQQEAGAPPPEHYGQLYTLPEICALVATHGLPGGRWGNSLPATVPNYIEAQVWNPGLLRDLLRHSPAEAST